MTTCPIPGFRGSLRPEGSMTSGVLILGEAMGDNETSDSLPFRPHAEAGSVLERAITRSGFLRDHFLLWNTVPAQPPHNWLEGAPYEAEALAWGRPLLENIIATYKPRVILALGNVALAECAGLRSITSTRGYPLATRWGIPVIGSLHPSYLRRGAMSHLGVLMHDLKFAVALSHAVYTHTTNDLPIKFWSPVLWRDVSYSLPWPLADTFSPRPAPAYVQYPTDADIARLLDEAERQPEKVLSYDIETPWSDNTPEDELDKLEGTEILSIQFSLARGTGTFIPFTRPSLAAIRAILSLRNPKVGANCWRFDAPRLSANGMAPRGQHHDLRWAWKHFQPDLPASLQFITSFYAPEAGPWKHLKAWKEWYGIRDVDMNLACLGDPT